MNNFSDKFELLTGHPPFPWQERLYSSWSSQGQNFKPVMLPTGVGKTSVIAIWLIVLCEQPSRMPRRLVYVVNRRTIVDQTSEEVLKLTQNLEMAGLSGALQNLCAIPLPEGEVPLAVSTLRGQMADNRAWSADPCRPAVIVGTVDLIGSRLLFSGYRIGFKSRPLHAAFLAQDTLIVHDEAHLEPAFQTALENIVNEQRAAQAVSASADGRPLAVVPLTATMRTSEMTFGLQPEDLENGVISRRLNATKRLRFHQCEEKDNVIAEKLAELLLAHEQSGQAILLYVRTIKILTKVKDLLEKGKEGTARSKNLRTLTGTMRGFERDRLVMDPVFLRFLSSDSSAGESTAYLLCTSAGEVGVNMSAKHLVCDLSTFESMAQRFGRVNRFGDETELLPEEQTVIDVVHPDPEDLAESNAYDAARRKTLEILLQLDDASPENLRGLPSESRQEGFSPSPRILPITDILLDNWSLTSIRQEMPGRPPVAPFLHGIDERDEPRTTVAWREEVELDEIVFEVHPRETLLETFPLKPHETLSDTSKRVFDEMVEVANRLQKEKNSSEKHAHQVWLIDNLGQVTVLSLAQLVAEKENVSRIANCTLLLPPSIGGLDAKTGMLNGREAAPEQASLDVCDQWRDAQGKQLRRRTKTELEELAGWKCVSKLDTSSNLEAVNEEADSHSPSIWYWYEAVWGGDQEDSFAASNQAIPLNEHLGDVESFARCFASKLSLNETQARALVLAARWHDLGKNRDQWQRAIGNRALQPRLAKSGPKMKPLPLGDYRHEFGSLLDTLGQPEFANQPEEVRELILHLIAAHHGRARPHFTDAEATDPEHTLSRSRDQNSEIPHRFARLQQKYGRWGLAYLESLLRAADYAASSGIKPRNES